MLDAGGRSFEASLARPAFAGRWFPATGLRSRRNSVNNKIYGL
jgi:hypothetical protein